MKLLRRTTALILTLTLGGCASTAPGQREPANLPERAETASVDPVAAVYRDAVALKAFVLGPPNARGEREPVCQTDLYGRPDLAPSFLRVTTSRRTPELDLPKCTKDQEASLYTAAVNAARPQVAGPGAVLFACGINFATAAAIMTLYARAYHASAADSPLRKVAPVKASLSGTAVAMGQEAFKNGPHRWPRTLAATECTGLGAFVGQTVGYWLAEAP